MVKKTNIHSSHHTVHTCIYNKNKNGMGGIAIDKTTHEKIIIPDNLENFALDKDEIKVIAHKDHGGNLTGSIQTVIKHNNTHLVGYIQVHKNKFLLKVTNSKFGNYLVIIKSNIDKFDRHELVNTVITTYPNNNQPYFEVELVNSIGKEDEDTAFIAQLLIESNLPIEFSKAAIIEAEKIPEKIDLADINSRVDLRKLAFVTIDGEDAKDFDDAVYCYAENDIFHLYVAIADVAHYVKHESALDRNAYQRGTSVYFPKRVIPMLPEKLSNGLCSLKPKVDRLVMCCEMKIDQTGKILDYKVYNGIINSKARLTYNQVQKWLNELSLTPEELISNISNLYLVYQALLKERSLRGAIDFESIEPLFQFNQEGVVTNIQPRIRLESHKLIEECMLAANVSIADYLLKNNHPGLFRIHDKPSEEKFTILKNFLNSLAIQLNVSFDNLTPKHLAELLERVEKHSQFQAIQQTVLRTMQLAIYSPQNIGHFGLSYDRYLHFTSPIRRYPDLLVHRAVKYILLHKQYNYLYNLVVMGEETSSTERRAEELGRKVDSFYKCQFAKSHLGNEFKGLITSVINFGIFVYIPELLLDGLVHITELGADYFIFDDKKQTLTGKNSGIKFYSGQEVTVQIVNVDMAKLFIDLQLVTSIPKII